MDFQTARDPESGQGGIAVRLAVGVLQGVLLSLLTLASMRQVAPFDRPEVTTPLIGLLVTLPGLFVLLWRRMRGRSLAILLGIVAVMTVSITLHAVHQGPPAAPILSTGLVHRLLFAPLVFIVVSLGLAIDQDGRRWPRYAILFAAAWDLAILYGLAILFMLLSWAVLWLAAALFAMIGFHGFVRLLLRPWILPVVNSVAFSAAIAFCLRSDRLIAGARRLALALFGLLLPILGVLCAVFLVSLALVPLSRLWTTDHACLLLSLSAVLLVLLLNATYQDGEAQPGGTIRLSGRLAGIEILPLVVLAFLALALRVQDHGWSSERVVAAAGLSILAVYGVGYLVAACMPGRWLRLVEPVNIATAFLAIAVLFALLTPIADPARLSVASQLARLRSGLTPADRFDDAYLARGSGRYGRDALSALIDHPQGPDAALLHDRALAARSMVRGAVVPPVSTDPAATITVHPAGATLPDGLLAYVAAPGHTGPWLPCLHLHGLRCDAVILAPTPDGRKHVAFLQDRLPVVVLFDETASGWQPGGSLVIPLACAQARAAMLAGQATFGSAPGPTLVLPSATFDIEVPRLQNAPCGR